MGIGNFIDNFISGLAFGIAVNNPFYRGFGCYGGYGFGGGYSMNRVDFDTFANPFPNVFGNMSYIPSIQQDSIFDGFANPAPTIDFSQTMQNIWNDTFNPDSDFNKRMKEYFDNQAKNNTTTNYNYQTSVQGYDMPFSQFYLPNQISLYGGYPQFQFDMFTPSTLKANQDNETTAKKIAAQQNSTAASKTTRAADITAATDTRTSTTTSVSLEPDKTDAEDTKKSKKVINNSNNSREFAAIYQKLGITDTRFQKIFEECVLSLNEGRKNGKDYYIYDVKAMNKNGILQTTYDEYRAKEKHLPKRDVKNMTLEEMCDIYYTMFYVKGGAKDIKDDRLALYVFDSDVNMGVGTGKQLLERSGNNAERFEAERRKEYKRRKGYSKYKNTWNDRVTNTKKYADNNFSAVA